jgi:hypothetical protein
VEEVLDPATAAGASQQAAVNASGGSFLGIPYGWPLIVAAIALVALMWMARTPMRRVLWQVFFVTARIFGRWGLWLKEHGQAARLASSEKIIAHRADELNDRMIVLEDRIGRRAEKLPKETGPIIARLDSSTHSLQTSASALADINLEDAAERAFRAALPTMESGRGLNKLEKNIAQSTGRAMNERLVPLRPALTALKTEAPRLRELAVKLGGIEQRFNQGVDTVNKAFTEYEACLRGPDRNKIAGNHSLIIPWLIALLITVIALSGVFLNFFLIQRPMAEIVGESAKIGGVSLPTFAAMIVIFLEFVAGVVLMDAAGFTKLIPAFHTMTERSKKVMLVLAFVFLALFSFLEVALAIVRENIIETDQQTRLLATGVLTPEAVAANPDAVAGAAADPAAQTTIGQSKKIFGISLITWAQVVLAALIPWLLATAALPLETIVRNSVFLVQKGGAYALLGLSFICKTLNVALKSLGLFVLSVYDLIIFAPLWVERKVKGVGSSHHDTAPPQRDRQRDRELDIRNAGKGEQKPAKNERELERQRA